MKVKVDFIEVPLKGLNESRVLRMLEELELESGQPVATVCGLHLRLYFDGSYTIFIDRRSREEVDLRAKKSKPTFPVRPVK